MFKKWIVLLILPLALAACGKNDDNKDDSLKAVQQKSESIQLAQTFTNEAVGLTVQYPADWVAQASSSGVEMANAQAGMDSPALDENEITIVVETNPLEALGITNLDQLFESFKTGFETDTTVSDVTTIKIGTLDAKRMTIKHPTQGSALLYAWMNVDGESAVAVLGMASDLDTLEPYALAIARSVKFSAQP